MPIDNPISEKNFQKEFRAQLARAAGFPNSDHIKDNSSLYTPPQRTPGSATAPAQLGFPDDGGATVMKVVRRTADTLLSARIMQEPFSLGRRDLRARSVGVITGRAHRRLCDHIINVVWLESVQMALAKETNDTKKTDETPKWVGNQGFDRFTRNLKQFLLPYFPDRQLANNQVRKIRFGPQAKPEIRAAKKNINILEAVIKRMIVPYFK